MKLLVVHEVNYLVKIIYEFQILSEILSLQGHEVTIVDYDDSWRETPARRLAEWRTTVHSGVRRAYPSASVTVRRPGMVRLPLVSRVSGAALTALELARLVRRSRFDAIMLYGLPTVGLQTLAAARLAGVPVVFRSIDILHRLVPSPALVPATRILERIVYNRVRAIACVTPQLERHVRSYGVPAERVRVIPSGVDAAMFSPGPPPKDTLAEWRIPPDDPVVLFMGTIYGFSGLDRLIREWPMLLDVHPRARLLVVGVGPDETRLQRLAADAGVSGNVVFTGLQRYDRLPDIVRAAEVCINPFELNEVTRDILPTKLFQYLACGRPVVATRLPGTLPFLAGEEAGVVYAASGDFIARVGELLGDAQRRRRLGAAGESWVRARYDWRRIAEEVTDWIGEYRER